MATTEIRKKLSKKQLEALKDSGTKLSEAREQLDEAQKFAGAVTSLILDALDVPEGANPVVDEKTNELVYSVEVADAEAPAPEAAAVPEPAPAPVVAKTKEDAPSAT